jgi:hypothetical protein
LRYFNALFSCKCTGHCRVPLGDQYIFITKNGK